MTIVFEARIVGGEATPTPEALEIRSFGPRRSRGPAWPSDDDLGAARLDRPSPPGGRLAGGAGRALIRATRYQVPVEARTLVGVMTNTSRGVRRA